MSLGRIVSLTRLNTHAKHRIVFLIKMTLKCLNSHRFYGLFQQCFSRVAYGKSGYTDVRRRSSCSFGDYGSAARSGLGKTGANGVAAT